MSTITEKSAEEVQEAEIPLAINEQGHEIDKLNDVFHDLKTKLGPIMTNELKDKEVDCQSTQSDIGTQINRNNQRITAIREQMEDILKYLAI